MPYQNWELFSRDFSAERTLEYRGHLNSLIGIALPSLHRKQYILRRTWKYELFPTGAKASVLSLSAFNWIKSALESLTASTRKGTQELKMVFKIFFLISVLPLLVSAVFSAYVPVRCAMQPRLGYCKISAIRYYYNQKNRVSACRFFLTKFLMRTFNKVNIISDVNNGRQSWPMGGNFIAEIENMIFRPTFLDERGTEMWRFPVGRLRRSRSLWLSSAVFESQMWPGFWKLSADKLK